MPIGVYKHHPHQGFQKGNKLGKKYGFQKGHPRTCPPKNPDLYKTNICPICNISFEDLKCRKRKYCSRECKNKDINSSHLEKYQFQKGIIPWNKGIHGTNSGSFKKGHSPFPIKDIIAFKKKMKKVAPKGENHYAYGKTGKLCLFYGKSPTHGKGACYKSICMRSSWEIKIAKWLDKHSIRWQYESKRFELKDRTYAPDFYLPDRNIYWEVKGWFNEKDQETTRQFRELYPDENLLVLTKSIYEAVISQ